MEKVFDEKHIEIYKDILDVFIYDASARINKFAMDAFSSLEEGDALTRLLHAAGDFTTYEPVNVRDARRRIAERLIYDNRYTF